MRRQALAAVLVGPSALLREGLARILGAANFRIVASACHVHDLPPTSPQRAILLVIDSGGDADAAVAQIALFKEQNPSARVAVLTDRYRLSEMTSAFRAGANLYFGKHIHCDAFIKALELVMLGETILPPELLSLIGDRKLDGDDPIIDDDGHWEARAPSGERSVPQLSARERCILRCMVDGDPNKVIARKIEIAEATVKVHVKAILRKIRVRNRTQAAIWAMNHSTSLWPLQACQSSATTAPSPPPLAPDGPIESMNPTGTLGRHELAAIAAISDLDGRSRKIGSRKVASR